MFPNGPSVGARSVSGCSRRVIVWFRPGRIGTAPKASSVIGHGGAERRILRSKPFTISMMIQGENPAKPGKIMMADSPANIDVNECKCYAWAVSQKNSPAGGGEKVTNHFSSPGSRLTRPSRAAISAFDGLTPLLYALSTTSIIG